MRSQNKFNTLLCTFALHFTGSVIIQYYYSDNNKHADKQQKIKSSMLSNINWDYPHFPCWLTPTQAYMYLSVQSRHTLRCSCTHLTHTYTHCVGLSHRNGNANCHNADEAFTIKARGMNKNRFGQWLTVGAKMMDIWIQLCITHETPIWPTGMCCLLLKYKY